MERKKLQQTKEQGQGMIFATAQSLAPAGFVSLRSLFKPLKQKKDHMPTQ